MNLRMIALFLGFLSIPATSQAQSLPENAHKNAYGSGWSCNRGFYKSRDQCLAVIVPKNGKLNYSGHAWDCQRGFRKSGRQCLAVIVPENGKLNYSGNGWDCNSGFKKSANNCVTMTPQEIKRRKEIEKAFRMKMEKRKLQGVSGDDCETEYKTNAEVCVEITGGDLDCNESYLDNYYRDCDVALSYDVETDYPGGSYLDVEVECMVEIEYKGRQTFSTQSDSSSEDESHNLYAHGSDSETMRFNFSFSSYQEITSVKISSAECEIESVDLQ